MRLAKEDNIYFYMFLVAIIEMTKKDYDFRIKFKKQGIEVEPYIGFVEQTQIVSQCLENYKALAVENGLEIIPIIKGTYNILILQYKTSIKIKGFDGEDTVSGNVLDEYLISDILDNVIPRIKNYDEVWEMVVESIRLENVYRCLSKFAQNIPSAEDMQKSIKQMSDTIKENKNLFEKATEYSAMNSAILESKTELRKNIEKKKELNKKK